MSDGDSREAPRPAVPVRIRGVRKRYGAVMALHDVDLDIESGEFVTLLGPSGSGKTTLLMVLAGFIRPDAGSVRFGEAEMVRTPPHRRSLGMVFQNYALFPHMSVAENIAYPLRLRRMAKPEIARRVQQVLDLVQLPGFGERHVDALSGGQRQRIALARAVVFEPRVLLMDEPLSALDKQLREQMQIEIRHLHRRLGMTTIAVTHDQREALTISDRVAVIDHGRLQQFGTPAELYERPANRFVASFLGESTFLPITRSGRELRAGGATLPLADRVNGARAPILVVRPEKLSVAPALVEANQILFTGRVRERIYQGESVLVTIALPDGAQLTLRRPTSTAALSGIPEPGQAIGVALHADDAIIVDDTERPT